MKDLCLHTAPRRTLYVGLLVLASELCYVFYYIATAADLLRTLRAQTMLGYILLSLVLLVGGTFVFDLAIREQEKKK